MYIQDSTLASAFDNAVAEYIEQWPVTKEFEAHLDALIDFLIPQYIKEGKSQLVIAVGCTGGMHRSVFVSGKVGEALREQGYRVAIEHRDIKHNKVVE